MHCFLTVLALILSGGICFSVMLPSKVMSGFLHHIIMLLNKLCVVIDN